MSGQRRAGAASSEGTKTVVKLVSRILSIGLLASLLALAGPAQADLSIDWRSTAPVAVTKRLVGKGVTIKVTTKTHGSKVVKTSRSLWKGKKRIRDWSPQPGRYRVKTVFQWQRRVHLSGEVWVPSSNCDDFSTNGYDACAEGEYGDWDWQNEVRLEPRRSITRWRTVTVAKDETPGCVSRAEFRAVKDGMTMSKVRSIFGTNGRSNYTSSHSRGRTYHTCAGDPDWSYAEVDFWKQKGAYRVWFKWIYIDW